MKQQTAIKQLESEMNEIETEMKLASSCKNRKQDNENSEELKNFMDGQDEYSRMIQMETEEIQCKFFLNKKIHLLLVFLLKNNLALDRQISETEEKIKKQHRAMGGVHNSHQRHVTTQHTIRVLENRLNKATREFNEMLAKNAKLRENIQHLRSQDWILMFFQYVEKSLKFIKKM